MVISNVLLTHWCSLHATLYVCIRLQMNSWTRKIPLMSSLMNFFHVGIVCILGRTCSCTCLSVSSGYGIEQLHLDAVLKACFISHTHLFRADVEDIWMLSWLYLSLALNSYLTAYFLFFRLPALTSHLGNIRYKSLSNRNGMSFVCHRKSRLGYP